eukprot:GFKZ01013880.1.p1 GENE.GFKZ01013880.1~~GFKZ01013880.1.p1  ORF type:complete len:705 (-),score=114.10 GFKZ01013880.1:1879-3849(-)
MPPKSPSLDGFPSASSSLPLLVQLPDGERRQVDVPSTASIKDLKSSIAAKLASDVPVDPDSQNPDSLQGWDLGFGGSVLHDSATLNDYNIPEAYDHASGLLRTITESAHTDAGKKVEALDKAVAVVKGISRGERDMEKLISAVFDDDDTNEIIPQPSLSAAGRRGRSRVPALNFSNLPPIGPSARSPQSGRLTAPPTPIQLIRRLSTSRPDLYDPKAAERADASGSGEIKRQSSWFTNALELGGIDAGPGASALGAAGASQPNSQPSLAEGSGELKRGNTWFKDVFNMFGSDNVMQDRKEENVDLDSEGDGNDIAANSEDDEPDGDSDGGNEVDPRGDTVPKAETHVAAAEQKAGGNAAKEKHDDKTEVNLTSAAPSSQSGGALIKPDGPSANQKPSLADTNPLGGAQASEAGKAVDGAANVAGQTSATGGSDPAAAGGQSAQKPVSQDADDNKLSGLPAAAREHKIGLHPENPEGIKVPKKRGRKRKHPHLTDEQRRAHRQAQNRESAKMSRIRRKHMTAEYERRVGTLEGENANLRDTVAALTDRLQILQNLLTISVHKSPAPQALQQHMPGSQLPQGTLPNANGPINAAGALNIATGLNPQGINGQMPLNPATSFAPTLQATALNPQVGLSTQGAMSAQGRHLPKLNMTYKNF